ncbi:MAG: GGDEF domain-containing protein [Roseibium sp.]|uniref:GGDEF domain-containing protein n=1 Tax=Roseibium sp. TaxID=1936156 RepID=UPI0032991627
MDKFSLLAANCLILTVFSVSFLTAFHDMKRERFWRTWVSGNLFLAAALFFYILDTGLPEMLAFIVPNGLMIAAFARYNQGAMQFNDQKVCYLRLLIPMGIMLATSLPAHISQNYALTYTVTNLMLAFLATATAAEYWSRRADGLSSRYGLAFSFMLIAASFALRVAQGIGTESNQIFGLTNEFLLPVHLMIALVFVTTSGAFSLSLAFERKSAEQQDAAHRDPLTGTFNRREFTLRLKELLQQPERGNFAVVQFDLDHFKSVNDRFGHGAGDEALQICTDIMQWHLREEDCLARVGGEEFAALMPEISHSEALEIAERIRATIADTPLHFAPEDVRLTLSAGIYHGKGDGMDHKQLLELADDGLYESKHAGRNRVSLTRSDALTIVEDDQWSNASPALIKSSAPKAS